MSRFCTTLALVGALVATLPWTSHAQNARTVCPTSAESGATVVFSSSLTAHLGPAGAALARGASPDSIAVLSEDGECRGATGWNGPTQTTLGVAGNTSVSGGGIADGSALQFRIYDASRDETARARVEYASCSDVDSAVRPLCEDAGRYRKDAVYVVTSIDTERPAVGHDASIPDELSLDPAAPNPARSQTTIRYALPNAQDVQLELYDLLGRRVRTLVNRREEAGQRQYVLDVSGLSSGVYFYRLRTGHKQITRKVNVVR